MISVNLKAHFRFKAGEMPSILTVQSISTVFSSCLFLSAHFLSLFVSVVSSPGCVGWLSMFQATAPVSIPVGPELAGIGSGNGIGPGTGTGNDISVSWQSPPVIFKGIPVSEALSHGFLSQSSHLSCYFHLQPFELFATPFPPPPCFFETTII